MCVNYNFKISCLAPIILEACCNINCTHFKNANNCINKVKLICQYTTSLYTFRVIHHIIPQPPPLEKIDPI